MTKGLDGFIDRVDKRSSATRTYQGDKAIERVGVNLDANINFRVNSALKDEFDHLCKLNHTSMARELKRFMTEAVRLQRLI